MRLIPRSTAARIVAIDWLSSVPPHIQPPMAQVPSAIREGFSAVPWISPYSMWLSRREASGIMSRPFGGALRFQRAEIGDDVLAVRGIGEAVEHLGAMDEPVRVLQEFVERA